MDLLIEATGRPTNPGERLFLDISVAVIVGLILLWIVIAKIRRRREGGRGLWWRGPYAPRADKPAIRRNPDQTRSSG